MKLFRTAPIFVFVLLAAVGCERRQDSDPGASGSSQMEALHPTYSRVRVSAAVEEQLLIHKTSPVYPPEAKAKHIEGTVTLAIIVDKQGGVIDLKSVSGDPVLVPAAMSAVKQWRYEEYVLDGHPVEVETTVQVNFRLDQQ